MYKCSVNVLSGHGYIVCAQIRIHVHCTYNSSYTSVIKFRLQYRCGVLTDAEFPCDTSLFNGACYWYNETRLSFSDALATCEAHSGTLAMLSQWDIYEPTIR